MYRLKSIVQKNRLKRVITILLHNKSETTESKFKMLTGCRFASYRLDILFIAMNTYVIINFNAKEKAYST